MQQKVCIIEDEDNIREIYQIALEKEGYEVLTACDGEEGLELLKKNRPDLVLVDLMMPKKDGITLMKEMLADEKLSKIPVIILTNFGSEEMLEKVKDLQSEFYLIKSQYQPKDVVKVVREVMLRKYGPSIN